MMETREPEIKLFGKNISLPERGLVVLSETVVGGDGDADGGDSSCSAGNGMDKDERENDMDGSIGDPCETSPGEKEQISSAENCQNRSDSSESDEDSKPTQLNEDSKDGEDKGDATNSQQKTLKKPDKILPCPRCNSMDTKFCYYNNYNVNQPRHFCKSCQRYWTAGGTMRNVPVGAGRRKNKNSSSNCRNMIISEALHPNIKPNGTVLSFGGPDSPLCESMSSVLNLSEKKAPKEPVMPSIPCLPPVPWPYSWNPAICPPGYPMPFYPPPPYFNCIPWMPSMPPNSPTLGKRSSDGELLKAGTLEGNRSLEKKRCEGSVLVPKTLRIDDPDEAAKSSIWTTLGINYDSINKRGMFNAFQTKGEKHATTPSPLLQANPAALSRSASFQEKA